MASPGAWESVKVRLTKSGRGIVSHFVSQLDDEEILEATADQVLTSLDQVAGIDVESEENGKKTRIVDESTREELYSIYVRNHGEGRKDVCIQPTNKEARKYLRQMFRDE
ncbi:MAG TPA: hypothetical protein VJG90_04045 [Candidatus Nanoarchaeia archaeon]|nr:hypothetical protein [Candidatus Nanoarchaeia archaeon]